MSQIHKHSIPANIADSCLINRNSTYEAQYQQSVTDPDAFWGEQGKILRLDAPLYAREEHLILRRATSPLNGMKTAR